MNLSLKHYIIQRPVTFAMFTILSLCTVALSLLKTFHYHVEIPLLLENFIGGDIYLHFTFALLLTLILIRVISASLEIKNSIYLAISIVSVCCMIDESLQIFSDTRTFSLFDLGSSLLGILIAAIMIYLTDKYQSMKTKRKSFTNSCHTSH